MCEVFGGVTGRRRAPLKENGVVVKFATSGEAMREVMRLCERRRTHSLPPGVECTYEVEKEES